MEDYKIDLSQIYDSFFYSEVATVAENETKAKSILFDKIKNDEK